MTVAVNQYWRNSRDKVIYKVVQLGEDPEHTVSIIGGELKLAMQVPFHDFVHDFTQVEALISDNPPIVEYVTGAHREADTLPYDEVPAEWLKWLAEVFQSGEHYGKHNWKKGLPASTHYNHLMHHLSKYKEGDRTEDHLGKVAWGALALKWTMKYHPELDDLTEKVYGISDQTPK